MIEITLKEVEVAKLNLEPGDVLIVKVKSDRVAEHNFEHLEKEFNHVFKNNKVFVIGMYSEDDLQFSVVKEETRSCGPSFCDDCTCGKKEQSEI